MNDNGKQIVLKKSNCHLGDLEATKKGIEGVETWIKINTKINHFSISDPEKHLSPSRKR